MSQQAATNTKAASGPARASRFAGPQSAWARRRERLGWLLVTPSVLVVVVVALYPLLRTFIASFTNERMGSTRPTRWVGFENYTYLLGDSTFLKSVTNTVIFSLSSVFFEALLGLIIALVIHSNFKGRGLMRTAMLIPWAIPTAVSSQMWTWMYNDVFGVINDLLYTRLGLISEKIAWLASPSLALPAIVSVDVWKTTPFMALLILAGLQVIPEDIYEAATVDGANRWQQFWSLTFPLLRPALLVALIFRSLDALRVFDIIYIMKGTATETVSMAVLARQTMIDLRQIGAGSAVSVVIFLILAVFVVIYTRFMRVEEA
ncbi:MAG TPA: sugar ABC transporter permease [Roseiflexaceae bacterium]|nr:sugar ABC transporter permease [Roseiflexaceae bacterium]